MVGNKEKSSPERILNSAKIELNSLVHAWISVVQFLNSPFFSRPIYSGSTRAGEKKPLNMARKEGEFRNCNRIFTDPTASLTLNHTEKVNKMRNILTFWEYRRSTLIAKIQVIKRLALSQLTYILTPLATNQKFINQINDIFIVFCNWNNKRSRCVKFL